MPDGDILITVENLSKAYRIWETPSARLKSPLLEAAASAFPRNSAPHRSLHARAARGWRDFYALRDISFTVRRGQATGIIGRNGSGKSTLLQLIAGTLTPTAGRVEVRGRIGALLELGSGFNPDFTGRENVYLSGAIYGLSRREMDTRFDGIADFADIGDFIDQPVKTYSTGMMVRLAFAVQTAVDPDILIVDEALGVGDIFFQQKCAARMRDLREHGTTLLFVSHDLASVRDLCEQALYLRHGSAIFFGESQQAIAHYYNEGRSETAATINGAPPPPPVGIEERIRRFRSSAYWWNENRPPPNGSARLLGIALRDEHGLQTTKESMGRVVTFAVMLQAREAGDYHVTLEMKNRYDQLVNSSSSYTCGLEAIHLAAGQVAIFELAMHLNFEAGRYTFQAVLGEGSSYQTNRGRRLDETPWLGPFEIEWDYENKRAPFLGMFGPPVQARYITE